MVKIIKNGRVIDPESRFDGRADLWIENGKIQKIAKKIQKQNQMGHLTHRPSRQMPRCWTQKG